MPQRFTVKNLPKAYVLSTRNFTNVFTHTASCETGRPTSLNGGYVHGYASPSHDANAYLPITIKGESIQSIRSNYKHFNPCRHVKREATLPADDSPIVLQFSKVSYNNNSGFVGCDGCKFDSTDTRRLEIRGSGHWLPQINPIIPHIYDEWFDASPDLVDQKMRGLDEWAIFNMLPKLDDGFSLPVFLAELGDLRGMLQQVVTIVSSFPAAVRALFRKPLAHISDGWLSAIFGWIPFVSDCKTIGEKLILMQSQLESFILDSGRRLTFHERKAISPHTFVPDTWFDQPIELILNKYNTHNLDIDKDFNEIRFSAKRHRVVGGPMYAATLDFEYRLPDWNKSTLKLLGGLDIFGVNLSISDVWARIPFSFVLDWFIGVNRWLSQYDLTNIPIEVIIYDFCRSIRFDYTCVASDIELTSFTRGKDEIEEKQYWSVSPASSFPFVTGKSYHRWTGRPARLSHAPFPLRTPSGMKIVTACALITKYTT